MRYYVVCTPDSTEIPPYVVAEVVRDVPVDTDRSVSVASALTGVRAVIATREELMAHPMGRTAFEAWERRDDSAFESESWLLAAAEEPSKGAHLRLVVDIPQVIVDVVPVPHPQERQKVREIG